jgi:O-antigen ligase
MLKVPGSQHSPPSTSTLSGASAYEVLSKKAPDLQVEVPAKLTVLSFLLLVFVGLHPLEQTVIDFTRVGEGDSERQVAFLFVFGGLFFLNVTTPRITSFRQFPLAIALLLAWCWLSLIWAIEPYVAFRKLSLTTIVLVSCFLCVKLVGARSFMRILLFSLVSIVIVDIISAVTVPAAAVHSAMEIDPGLAGNWKGLHPHKNTAGPIAASAIILTFFYGLEQKRFRWIGLCIICAFFLYKTQSKTCIGLVPICILFGLCYRYASNSRNARHIAAGALTMTAVVVCVIIYVNWSSILLAFDDPASLTGRVQIWPVLIAYASDHPLLGSGYGSFWSIGATSPVYEYADGWITDVFHGHNGYLDVLVETGFIGLGLLILSVIIVPSIVFANAESGDLWRMCTSLSLWLFGILNNCLESTMLDRDAPMWVIIIFMIAIAAENDQTVKGRKQPANGWSFSPGRAARMAGLTAWPSPEAVPDTHQCKSSS